MPNSPHLTPSGVLLINLGTPASPGVSDVRQYLKEFLSDRRVLDLPWLVRQLLLRTVILPFRPRQSAKAYQKIWQPAGSPLLFYSQQLTKRIREILGEHYLVELGMRYGEPSITHALKKLQHCEKLIIIPLFPQYSSAATGSAIENTLNTLKSQRNFPEIKIINDFFNYPEFIQAIAEQIRAHTDEQDFILMSYHGLPERQIIKSGCLVNENCNHQQSCPIIKINNRFCYRAQCYATSRAIAAKLNLTDNRYAVSFQSRLGKTPWIKPYTDLLLPQLYQRGVRHLALMSPSFVADCLETLEELGIRARKQWENLGGRKFTLIPCLNNNEVWAQALVNLIRV